MKKVNLENSFDCAFGSSEISEEKTLDCCRIQDFSGEVSTSVKELFSRSSSNLSEDKGEFLRTS